MSHTPSRFAHHRLDACRVALELFVEVERLALPKGYADLRDQLRRAAGAVVRHLAEGANRSHPKDKAARFAVACGECGEVDAALEMAQALRLAPPERLRAMRARANRVAAMLCGLVRRERERAEA